MSLDFLCYAGIGDIAWVYSKLIDVAKQRPVSIGIEDHELRRASDFVDMLPHVKNLGYIRPPKRWNWLPIDANIAALPDGLYHANVNPWLESGIRIEKIWPLQQTHYHYQINTKPEHKVKADGWIKEMPGRPKIGFYCGSGKDPENVQHWKPKGWARFAKGIHDLLPGSSFVCFSGWFDTKTGEVVKIMREMDIPTLDLTKKTHIGEFLEMVKQLDYFFAYNSGLAILSEVVQAPVMMFYPSNVPSRPDIAKFPDSYAEPAHVNSGFHLHVPFLTVDDSVKVFQQRGLQHLMARMKP